MPSKNTTRIRALPTRSPFVDENGNITRPWLLTLEGFTATGEAAGGVGGTTTTTTTGSSGPPSSQPSDWSLSVVEYAYGDIGGKNSSGAIPVAHVRAVVNTNTAGIAYYSAFGFFGAAAPSDPAQWGDPIDNQLQASTGATILDWWVPQPDVDSVYWVVLTASTSTFEAFPTNVTIADAKSTTILAVHAPAQPASLACTLYRATRGGVDSGALAFTWPAPADLEYFGGKVYRVQCDSSYTIPASTLSADIDDTTLTIPITSTTHFVLNETGMLIDGEQITIASISAGSITAGQRGAHGTTAAAHTSGTAVTGNWDFIGVGLGQPGDAQDGFDQRKINGGTYWPLGPEAYFVFKVQSIARALDTRGNNIENTTAGPTANLHVPAGTGVSPSVTTPAQPASGDWTISVVAYGHDDSSGQNWAEVQVVVTLNDPNTTEFRVLAYQGGSPPADPGLYGDVVGIFKECDQAKAATGSTTIQFWVVRQLTSITLEFIVLAANTLYWPQASDAGAAKSLTINPISIPSQVTSPSVTALLTQNGGVTTGRLTYSCTLPNDLEIAFVLVERIQTDNTYAPLGGATWATVAQLQIPNAAIPGPFSFQQPETDSWVWIDAESWWQFRFSSVSRAQLINTTSRPTANLHMAGNPGLDSTTLFNLDPGTLAIIGGKLQSLTNPGFVSSVDVTTMQVVAGQLSITGLDLSKALGSTYNTAEFKIDSGTHKLTVNGVDLSKAISGTVGAALGVSSGVLGVQASGITASLIQNFAVGNNHFDRASFNKIAIVDADIVNLTAAKITAGTLAAGVVYAGSITANQIVSGTIASNIIYAGTIAVSQLVAGTAIFTGDTLFQRNVGGAYVGINSNGIAVSGQSSSSGGGFVTVTPSGITLQNGGSFGPYVVVQSNGVLLANPSTNGQLSLTSGGLNVSIPGSGSVIVTSGGIQLLNAGGFGLRLDTGGGVTFTDNTNWSISISSHNIAGAFKMSAVQIVAAGSGGYHDATNGANYRMNGGAVIDTNGIFVGAGVNTPFYGIAAAGFNPFVGGQWFGANYDMRWGVTLNGSFAWAGFSFDNGLSFYSGVRVRGGVIVDKF